MNRLTLLFAWLALSACGGRVELPGPSESQAGASATGVASAGAGAGDRTGASPVLPQHDLGECAPGFNPKDAPARPCPWQSPAGLCFATEDAACACVCPPDRDSICYSGFPQPGVPTLINCN